MFATSSHNLNWILKPSLIDDNESDSSSSFRSNSREVSPHLAATPATVSDFLSSSLTNTPAMPAVDDQTVPTFGSRDFSFEAADLLSGGTLESNTDIFGIPNYMDAPSPLHLTIDSADRLLNVDLYTGKDLAVGKTSPTDLFSPLPW